MTRVAASRSPAGSTASRYARPPRSGVAVEARKTVMAFKSRSRTLVGCIGPTLVVTPLAARGQGLRGMQSSNSSATFGTPTFVSPLLRLPPELLLQRLHHEVLHGDLVRHAVQLEAVVKVFGDARRQLSDGFVALGHRHQAALFFDPGGRPGARRRLRRRRPLFA